MGSKSTQRPTWRPIEGNPEGVALGSPGDLLYSTDTDILWIKQRGRGTPLGWVPLAKLADASGDFTVSGIANLQRICSSLGTPLEIGDFVLSAGWGASGALSGFAVPSTDTRGIVIFTALGAGIAANPTVTFTFKDGPYPSAPVVVPARGDISAPSPAPWTVTMESPGSVVFTFAGTPVSANVYRLLWHAIC